MIPVFFYLMVHISMSVPVQHLFEQFLSMSLKAPNRTHFQPLLGCYSVNAILFPHPFVQAVCVLWDVDQTLCESVAAGVSQGRMFATLKARLSQQNGPDLTHRLTPLLLPEEKHILQLSSGQLRGGGRRVCPYFLVLWVNLSVSLSRVRAYSASMSPRRRRNSERSDSCCCFTSTWESKIFIWSVNWARRSGSHKEMEPEREIHFCTCDPSSLTWNKINDLAAPKSIKGILWTLVVGHSRSNILPKHFEYIYEEMSWLLYFDSN